MRQYMVDPTLFSNCGAFDAVLRRGRLHAGDFGLVDRGRRTVVGCGLAGLAKEILDPTWCEGQEYPARRRRGVAEVVLRAAWPEGEPAGPDGMHRIADIDFESPVEQIPELILDEHLCRLPVLKRE